jgi:hypothetical protein
MADVKNRADKSAIAAEDIKKSIIKEQVSTIVNIFLMILSPYLQHVADNKVHCKRSKQSLTKDDRPRQTKPN